MKWLPRTGSTQTTADGRYVIVNANSQHWVSYALTPYSTGEEIGLSGTEEKAREICESHEARLYAERKAG